MNIKSSIISIILFLTLTFNVTALVIGSDDEEILIDEIGRASCRERV